MQRKECKSNNESDIIIGIDPDVELSGVAFLRKGTKELSIQKWDFCGIMSYFKSMDELGEEAKKHIIVVIEAGWMRSGNWHLPRKCSKEMAAKIGNSTGRNHEVARKLAEIAKFYGLNVIEHAPLKKIWKGPEGKITHDELAYFTHMTYKRTNQDQRDAALLAWSYAGFPIRIKSHHQ